MDKLLDMHYEGHEELGKYTLLNEGPLEKTAAAEEVQAFVSQIQPKDGFFYIHINAMGAGEYYGSNRNGDYFPEEQLIRYHKTFETNPAHLFRHHINKDPTIAIGKVVFSYYNPRMHRVELIVEVDKVKAAPEYEKLLRGEYPATSMACNTPFDVCSICGNQARSRQQYCQHLTSQLNQLMPDGRKVMALNLGPLTFFDISVVIRPADVTSSVLMKVAGHQYAVPSVDAALSAGVNYIEKEASVKTEALEKLANLIKEIDGEIVGESPSLSAILDRVVDPSEDLSVALQGYPFSDVMNAFAELGINPSLEFLSKYFAAMYLGASNFHLGPTALAVANNLGVDSLPYHLDAVPEVEEHPASPILIKLLGRYVEGSSYSPEMVEKRAGYDIGTPDRPTGYTNWAIGRVAPVQPQPAVPEESSVVKTFMTIAGSAMLAKYMIAGLVNRKLRRQNTWLKSSIERSMTKSAEATVKLMEGGIKRQCKAKRG